MESTGEREMKTRDPHAWLDSTVYVSDNFQFATASG
jgi:hypothetical protein